MLTNRLKELRDEYGLTTNAIALSTKLSLDTVRKLTYRTAHVPNNKTLRILAEYFELENPLDLLVWVDETIPDPSLIHPLTMRGIHDA